MSSAGADPSAAFETASATSTMKRGLFLLQLPPPVHGVSVVNASVVALAALCGRFEIELLRADYSSRLDEIGRLSLTKCLRWIGLLFRFGWLTWRRAEFVYFTPVPTGLGFLRDVPFILIGKVLCSTVILHLHGRGVAQASRGRLWRWLYRTTFGHCAIISASRGMQRNEIEPLQLRGARLYVVPNAAECVDVERFRTPRDARDPPRILFLSSTFPAKGIFDLLRALECLVQDRIAFQVEIVGSSSSEWERQLKDEIERRDLKGHVVVRGALFGPEKYAAFARADLFVHPSQNDYFPLVLLEAMQFGLPIVATHVGAIPEIVEDCAGILVAPADVQALGNALRSMLLDGARRARCGAAARRIYLDRFVPQRFTAALLSTFVSEGVA